MLQREDNKKFNSSLEFLNSFLERECSGESIPSADVVKLVAHLRSMANLFLDGHKLLYHLKTVAKWLAGEDFPPIHGERDYKRCFGLPFIAQIGADGGVYTCYPFFGYKDFLHGNLHEETFEQIWYGERRRKLTEKIARELDLTKCMTYCRHHQINKFLWQIIHPPEHVNFI